MRRFELWLYGVAICTFSVFGNTANGQSFGVELHNTLMPASGGMGGASTARPQDLTSAINANPATLTQFQGTQFLFGGAWAEPTYNVEHDGGVLPGIGTYSAKSGTPGAAGGNIGVTQDFSALGLPATLGIGFISSAGGGADFRDVAASNGTSSQLVVLEITNGVGVQMNDRLSAGASISLGTAFYDGLFVGQSAMVPDYALRGNVGFAYDLAPSTTLGFYYQTKQNFTFDDAIRLELAPGVFDPITRDVKMSLPDNLVLGIANSSLMDGQLLLAFDVIYKQWDNADLFEAVYDNQWVFQAGAQYSSGRKRLRLGYVFAEDPLQSNVGISAGGVTVGVDALQYIQAQLAVVNEHRITAGVGIVDALPGVDFDLFAGGMFYDSQRFGASAASLESYWIGAGLTWRFGRGSCHGTSAPDKW
jgi:long-chain fatty acid transport protein